MHAYLGPSVPIFLLYERWRLRYDPLSLYMHLCIRACSNFMRQQAMGSKMVFNRPVPVNRLVSTIADSASFFSLYLYVLPSAGGVQFIHHTADA